MTRFGSQGPFHFASWGRVSLAIAGSLLLAGSGLAATEDDSFAKTKALALSRLMEAAKKLGRPLIVETTIEMAHIPDELWEGAMSLEPGQFLTLLAGWTGTKREQHNGVQLLLRDRQDGSPTGDSDAAQALAWASRLSPDQLKALLTPDGLSTAKLDDQTLWTLASVGGPSSLGLAMIRHRADSNVGVMGSPYVEFVREGKVRRVPLPGSDMRRIHRDDPVSPPADWRTLVPSVSLEETVPGPLDFGPGAWTPLYKMVNAATRQFDLQLGYDFRLAEAEVFAAGSMTEETWLKVFRRLVTSQDPSSSRRSETAEHGALALKNWFGSDPDSIPLQTEPLNGFTAKDFLEGREIALGGLLSQNPHLGDWARKQLNLGPNDRVRLGLRPILRLEAPGWRELPRRMLTGAHRVVFDNVGSIALDD